MIALNKTTGTAITDINVHVSQSIDDIITTPLGSRVMRRDYGSFIPALIDQPLNDKTVLRLYAATVAAIMRWEPRFKISSISLTRNNATATIEVAGQINGETTTITTPVTGGI